MSNHHHYGERDVARLLALANGCGFVTTEKDAVKLTSRMRERLGSLTVAGLRVEFLEEGRVAESIARRVMG